MKNLKKLISLILVIGILSASVFCFAGCNDDDDEDTSSKKKKNKVSNVVVDDDYDYDYDDDEEEEEEEEEVKKPASDKKENKEENKDKNDAKLGDKYVDYNNMKVSINGKVYTIGKTTLQDMIDDGVEFSEDDLANAENNLNAGSRTDFYTVDLGSYNNLYLEFKNSSKTNKKASECELGYVSCYFRDKQNKVKFSFAEDITEQDLLDNAGEPTDKRNYESDNYKSVTYIYRDGEYNFDSNSYEFNFVNGALYEITMSSAY